MRISAEQVVETDGQSWVTFAFKVQRITQATRASVRGEHCKPRRRRKVRRSVANDLRDKWLRELFPTAVGTGTLAAKKTQRGRPANKSGHLNLVAEPIPPEPAARGDDDLISVAF